MKKINLKLCLGNIEEVLSRKVEEMSDYDFYNKPIAELDRNTNYITSEGTLIHVTDWTVDYGEDRNGYIAKSLTEYRNEKKDNGVKGIIKNIEKKKQELNIDDDVVCWECGNLLDIDGNCSTCGCSKEI